MENFEIAVKLGLLKDDSLNTTRHIQVEFGYETNTYTDGEWKIDSYLAPAQVCGE
jgi:hypothetical protein